jgi:hypothetical protein
VADVSISRPCRGSPGRHQMGRTPVCGCMRAAVRVAVRAHVACCAQEFFRDRDCITLVRPMHDETKLQRLGAVQVRGAFAGAAPDGLVGPQTSPARARVGTVALPVDVRAARAAAWR